MFMGHQSIPYTTEHHPHQLDAWFYILIYISQTIEPLDLQLLLMLNKLFDRYFYA
jgi:hypothetical protein